MAKLKNKFSYLLALVAPIFSMSVIADDEPTNAGTKEEAEQPAADAKPKPTPQNQPPSDVYTPKKDPKLCAQARGNMPILENGPRVRFTDEKGVVRFMTDEERVIEKERTQDAIDAYCD